MIKQLLRKPFSLLKQFYRKLSSIRAVDAFFDGDRNVASFSTLQVVKSTGKKNDLFYLQTQIRICAHIAEKDLDIPVDKPIFRQFARELSRRLQGYQGPNIVSIENARNILQKYKDKYGL
jgi:hypothetical protein